VDPVALMSQSVVQYGCCAHGPLITMRIPRYLHSLFPVPLLLLLPYHPDRLTLGNSPSKEKKKKSSVRPCNPPVPEWSCYFSELAQIPEWVRNGLVTFPSWHKSQNGLVTFPRWHKSQNGLVTFPRWHKSRNGRVTQTFWYKSELDGKDSEIWH